MKKAIFLYDKTGIMAKPWLDAGYECWCFDGQHEPGTTRDGNFVKVGMWFDPYRTREHVEQIFDMVGSACIVVGFPDCTHLAASGAAWFDKKLKENPAIQAESTEPARMVMYVGERFGCPWVAENPVSVLSTLWRKPDHSFHPWQYGAYLDIDDIHPLYPDCINPRDAYPKRTCLWSGNGFVMPDKKEVGPSLHELDCGKLPADFIHLTSELFYDDKRTKPMYKPCGSPLWGYSKQHKKLGGKSLKTKNIRSATPRGFALAVFEFNWSL